jgi:dihydrodipicolinate synthase/N-acetylneuraminate lyase
LELGRSLWKKIFPICHFLEQHNYPSAVKTALELQGFRTGGVRKPFSLLQDQPRIELRKLLVDAGLQVTEE